MNNDELQNLIDKYSSEFYYYLFENDLTLQEWVGQKGKDFLNKYYISNNVYNQKWLKKHSEIFKNVYDRYPKEVFSSGYKYFAIDGGVLFEEEEFNILKECMIDIGDKYLIIIQNTQKENATPLRMCFPIDISWSELASGNSISTILFKMSANEYFVFSESCSWGKYVASESDDVVDIYGILNNDKIINIFKNNFRVYYEHNCFDRNNLPLNYKNKLIEF